jgi:hypothetical protein
LLPCPSFEKPEDILKLTPDEEVITVLGKQWARVVLEYDFSIVRKSGFGARPPEAEAMRLVSKHTSVPVPEVISTGFGDDYGRINMTVIPGTRLERNWISWTRRPKCPSVYNSGT